MILVLMGVSGSGKTTVGQRLAQRLRWPYHEADDFPPPANIDKMRLGHALTDDDRISWLEAIRSQMQREQSRNLSAIFTCSALKRAYRDQLRAVGPQVKLISLELDETALRDRLAQRTGHFFNPSLLASQLQTWEDASDADLRVDASLPVEEVVDQIMRAMGLTDASPP